VIIHLLAALLEKSKDNETNLARPPYIVAGYLLSNPWNYDLTSCNLMIYTTIK
jgi:hypothetical protein